MKAYQLLLMSAVASLGILSGCTDEWDKHYNEQEAVINRSEDATVTIVNETSTDYLAQTEEYSGMYKMFEDAGILSTMNNRDVAYTLFVVNNESLSAANAAGISSRATATDDTEEESEEVFLAKGHIMTAALAPDFIRDGLRLLMWNEKYVEVAKTIPEGGTTEEVVFNETSRIKNIIKTKNGYIYELDQIMTPRTSLLEVVEGLSDDYSIFKEAVLSKNVRVFDRSASLEIGVDDSGNTIYDSVFTVTNPYFLAKKFDISSESMKATMLIPSDELITNALNEAKGKLAKWGLERPDSILENWCFQAMFFNKEYTREDFENPNPTKPDEPDFTSIFGKQWRTTINKVDLDRPVKMSNGTAYYVTSLKIPQKDVLIWRFKDYFKWYRYMTATDKDIYFPCVNLTPASRTTNTDSYHGSPGGGWPRLDYEYLNLQLKDKADLNSTLTFIPFKLENLRDDNSYEKAVPYLIPPGEYTLHLGFGKISNMKTNTDIYLNGEKLCSINGNAQWKNYSRDRSGGGSPEFFAESGFYSATYDRDGKEAATFTIEGDEPVQIELKFVNAHNGSSAFTPMHWCIRPTKNCY